MIQVCIIDYGMGNLFSVARALTDLGAKVGLAQNPSDCDDATHLILPGVGSFADAMQTLQQTGFASELVLLAKKGIPLLGICLGMQVLFESGEEGGRAKGLGLLKGMVKKLNIESGERLPHIGWNNVEQTRPHFLFNNVRSGEDFYFVHSFAVQKVHSEQMLAITPFAGQFISAVAHENIFGLQFHPEKSSKMGLKILENFLKC